MIDLSNLILKEKFENVLQKLLSERKTRNFEGNVDVSLVWYFGSLDFKKTFKKIFGSVLVKQTNFKPKVGVFIEKIDFNDDLLAQNNVLDKYSVREYLEKKKMDFYVLLVKKIDMQDLRKYIKKLSTQSLNPNIECCSLLDDEKAINEIALQYCKGLRRRYRIDFFKKVSVCHFSLGKIGINVDILYNNLVLFLKSLNFHLEKLISLFKKKIIAADLIFKPSKFYLKTTMGSSVDLVSNDK